MVTKQPRVQLREISVGLRDLDISFTAQLVGHAGGLYLRVPRKEARFWEIQPGDQVQVKLTKLKRETPGSHVPGVNVSGGG